MTFTEGSDASFLDRSSVFYGGTAKSTDLCRALPLQLLQHKLAMLQTLVVTAFAEAFIYVPADPVIQCFDHQDSIIKAPDIDKLWCYFFTKQILIRASYVPGTAGTVQFKGL